MTAPKQLITVVVRPDGTVSAETYGILGAACLDEIAVLEDLLEATSVQSSYTADYARTAVTEIQENRNELGNT